jgi:hypothetical protein
MTHDHYAGLLEDPNYTKLRGHAEILRRTLEGKSVTLMGVNSPFWQCSYCGHVDTTPVHFRHTPECILAKEKVTS